MAQVHSAPWYYFAVSYIHYGYQLPILSVIGVRLLLRMDIVCCAQAFYARYVMLAPDVELDQSVRH
jgi:hypothetical protein